MMTRISTAIAAGAVAMVLVVPAAHSQQDSKGTPLGDVAREQREIHKTQFRAAKRYTNVDVVTAPAAPNEVGDAAPPSGIVEEEPVPVTSKTPAQDKVRALPARSIMDRVPESDSEGASQAQPRRTVMDGLPYPPVVVPAGTKITVWGNEVAVPVRVSFSTPIPAGSIVTFVHYGDFSCDDYFGCEYPIVELASVRVGGTTYPVETGEGGETMVAHRWVTYTLVKPVTIQQ